MVLANDVCLNINELLEILVDGSTTYSVIGLQDRMNTAFPDKGIKVLPSYPEWLLPGQTNFDRLLENPYVILTDQASLEANLFKNNVVPKNTSYIGWGENHTIRLNVYGRTPPECREIASRVLVELKRLKSQLWKGARCGLETSGIVDVPPVEELPQFNQKYVTISVKLFQMEENG